MGAHSLESEEGESSQGQRIKASEGHSQTGEHKGRTSQKDKKASERGALTGWRAQTKETRQENKRHWEWVTHILESAKRGSVSTAKERK